MKVSRARPLKHSQVVKYCMCEGAINHLHPAIPATCDTDQKEELLLTLIRRRVVSFRFFRKAPRDASMRKSLLVNTREWIHGAPPLAGRVEMNFSTQCHLNLSSPGFNLPLITSSNSCFTGFRD